MTAVSFRTPLFPHPFSMFLIVFFLILSVFLYFLLAFRIIRQYHFTLIGIPVACIRICQTGLGTLI